MHFSYLHRNIEFLPSSTSFFVKISGRTAILESLGVAAVILTSELAKWGPARLRPILLGIAMIVIFGAFLVLQVLVPPFTKRPTNILKTSILIMCVLAGVSSVAQAGVMVIFLLCYF